MKRLMIAFAAVAALSGAASAQDTKSLKGNIKIDGSSTVYPITEAVAEEFKKAAPNVNVTVGISGTGGGFKRFSAGEIDIADASRPIKKDEHETAATGKVEYIELPIAFDGLSIVINPKNTWVDKLSVDELKKIFLADSAAKTWRDVRAEWPAEPIKIFSPGTDSGTFDYFKEVVAGKDKSIRSDMSVSEDDNVLVRGVEGDKNAIGFFGVAYYEENKDKLKVVPIDNGKGAVTPTAQTIEDGTYAPFSRPLFIYVNKKSAERPEVKAFIDFYLKNAPALVTEVGYVKLPGSVYAAAGKNFASGKAGTCFLDDKGEKVSGPVTKVYK
ncbi:MAG: PstS family phosphate ABC transporter substrate-binding protein [Phycisphaerales bacterium]|nr:PstS family phosphate ABC transporter substrate-binding protein [Phycisphaerales bacterium]